MCAPAGSQTPIASTSHSQRVSSRLSSLANSLLLTSIMTSLHIVHSHQVGPFAAMDAEGPSLPDPAATSAHQRIEKAIFNAYLSHQGEGHRGRPAQEPGDEDFYARHSFYKQPPPSPTPHRESSFYKPVDDLPRAGSQHHIGNVLPSPMSETSTSGLGGQLLPETHARRSHRRDDAMESIEGQVDPFTLSLQEEELRRIEEMTREASSSQVSASQTDGWDSWRRAIEEGQFEPERADERGEEGDAGVESGDYYLVPASDTAKCFSCMSKFYEAVWPALSHVYKRPLNFTDACNEEFLDPHVVPVNHCPTICVSMWEEPAVAGVRIRGHIRGCLDDLLHNGFNQSIVSWYRWMQRDSCRQYRKRELFKLAASESDDSTINVCTCYADHCNASSAIAWRLSLSQSLLSSFLLFALSLLSRTLLI